MIQTSEGDGEERKDYPLLAQNPSLGHPIPGLHPSTTSKKASGCAIAVW